MAFVRDIRRNGVLNSGICPRHRVLNGIESNRYIGKSIAINQIEKKRDFNDIPTNNYALQACYSISNQIESNRKIYQLIKSIKFHINDITRVHTLFDNFERYSSNRVILGKYLKRDWYALQAQQLSVNYFSKYRFVIKRFPQVSECVLSRHVRVN